MQNSNVINITGNDSFINPETLEFMNKIKNDNIDDIIILRVDTNNDNNKYAILSKNENRIDNVNKSSLYSQLKNMFSIIHPNKQFGIKVNMIDDFIISVLKITTNIYIKSGIVKIDDFKSDYNYIVLSKLAKRIHKAAEGVEKRDLMTVYNERKHLFPMTDFIIDNLLSVDNNVNKPKNKEKIDLKHHFINHQAFTFQYCEKSGTFHIIKTVQGAGKNLFTSAHEKFYEEYMQIVQPEVFLGTGFNSILDGTRFVVLNEFNTSKKDREELSGRLKAFATDGKDRIRGMHKDLKVTKQVSNAIMFLNEELAINIDVGCRRTNHIECNTRLEDAAYKKLGIRPEDFHEKFIVPFEKEAYDFILTLFLGKVNVGLAKNVTIDNELKRKAIRSSNGRNKHLRDIILNGDLEVLDDYFLDVIDTTEYKIMKSQIKAGFIDNPSSEFLYSVLSEYEPSTQKNIKSQIYMNNVFGMRNIQKYKKKCGSMSSTQIRKLNNYDRDNFLNYMVLFSSYKDGDQGLEEAMFGEYIESDDLLVDNYEHYQETETQIEDEVNKRVAAILLELETKSNEKYDNIIKTNEQMIEDEVNKRTKSMMSEIHDVISERTAEEVEKFKKDFYSKQ